jgi:hypothetical protein
MRCTCLEGAMSERAAEGNVEGAAEGAGRGADGGAAEARPEETFDPRDLDALNALNDLNAELLLRLQETGVAVPSSTEIDGCYALRVANVNHRTRRADLDALIAGVLDLGAQLASRAAFAVARR